MKKYLQIASRNFMRKNLYLLTILNQEERF